METPYFKSVWPWAKLNHTLWQAHNDWDKKHAAAKEKKARTWRTWIVICAPATSATSAWAPSYGALGDQLQAGARQAWANREQKLATTQPLQDGKVFVKACKVQYVVQYVQYVQCKGWNWMLSWKGNPVSWTAGTQERSGPSAVPLVHVFGAPASWRCIDCNGLQRFVHVFSVKVSQAAADFATYSILTTLHLKVNTQFYGRKMNPSDTLSNDW